MHAAVKGLTILLVPLLTLGLPISASACSADVAGCSSPMAAANCCPSSDCRCRMSAPGPQTPQPAARAVAPSDRAARDAALVSSSLVAAPVSVFVPGMLEPVFISAALDGLPLYARSHAFLI